MERKQESVEQNVIKYEVEKILDHSQLEKGKSFFLVKWKNYDSDLCTWEPAENLYDSILQVQIYRNALQPYLIRVNDKVFKLKKRFKPGIEIFDQCVKSFSTRNGLKYPIVSEQEVCDNLKVLLKTPEELWDAFFVSYVRKLVVIREFHMERINQKYALKERELEINKLDLSQPEILVSNDVDLESLPENFTYIANNIPGENVNVVINDAAECECIQCDIGLDNCCAKNYYDNLGHIVCSPDTPIIECNINCRCGMNCINRVTQRGRSVKLMIYRTSDRCGWGVKSPHFIEKGTYLCEYVGVIITTNQTDERARNDDYIVQLVGNPNYIIDSLNYGNVSHFFNHSCNPNSAAYAVWNDNSCFHKICLFSIKDIQVGEELTIS